MNPTKMDNIHATAYMDIGPHKINPKHQHHQLFTNLTKINNIDPISYGFWTPQNELKKSI